jgi:hypothetical protein
MGTVVHNPNLSAGPRVAGLLADPQVRADAQAALAGGCPASEVAGVVGASVAEVERLAAGAAVGVVGWHVCPRWCTGHYPGRGDVFARGEDLHTGTTYTVNGVSACRGGADTVNVLLDQLDPADGPAGEPVVWLAARDPGEVAHRGDCWRLTPGQALRLAAALVLTARRALGGRLWRGSTRRDAYEMGRRVGAAWASRRLARVGGEAGAVPR